MPKAPTSIGKMKNRVVIQSLANTTDGQGGWTAVWSTFSTVWAEIVPVSSSERLFGSRLEYQRTHKCTMRFLSNVTTDMRIFYDSRYFQIKGIRFPNEEKFFMLLDLEENQGT